MNHRRTFNKSAVQVSNGSYNHMLSHTSVYHSQRYDPTRRSILVMGSRRAGKSSIYEVVFNSVLAKDLFMEGSTKQVLYNIDSFARLHLYDVPGSTTIESLTIPITMFDTLIFVIDAQDDYLHALNRLHTAVLAAWKLNPDINFEIFVHKVDGLSDEYKADALRDIQARVLDDLAEKNLEDITLSFYTTSVFDHSILEAFSKVIQKLMYQQSALEQLLDILCAKSNISKVILMDGRSHLYLATDSSPVDLVTHEVCTEALYSIQRFASLYKSGDYVERSDSARKYSSASVKLSGSITIVRWQIIEQFELVALLRTETWSSYKIPIEMNVNVFRSALEKLHGLELEANKRRSEHILPSPY